ELRQQAGIKVGARNCRPDFTLALDGHTIAVEIDGRAYHDAEADRKRDAAILKTGQVESIVRIPASIVITDPKVAVWVVAHWFPAYFLDTVDRLIHRATTTYEIAFGDDSMTLIRVVDGVSDEIADMFENVYPSPVAVSLLAERRDSRWLQA